MKLFDHAALLANFPEPGRPYPKRAGVRRLIVRPYIICYRVRCENQCVEVLRFWHGAYREPVL